MGGYGTGGRDRAALRALGESPSSHCHRSSTRSGPLTPPQFYGAADPASASWFLRRKLGNDKPAVDAMGAAARDAGAVAGQMGRVREKLGVLERLLAAHRDGEDGAVEDGGEAGGGSGASAKTANGSAAASAQGQGQSRGPFLGGSHPTHADAAVYAWYAATLAIRPELEVDIVGQTWRHDSLPLVAAWVDDVEAATGMSAASSVVVGEVRCDEVM